MDPRGDDPDVDIFTFDYTGRSGRKAKRGLPASSLPWGSVKVTRVEGLYFRMFPVSDVIPSRTTPVVTIGLIVLNALAFLYELQLTRPELQLFVQAFGVVPANFSWPSLITSMFLHEGWMHLLGNMLFLWIFGDNVEDGLSHGRYFAFYIVTGVIASLSHVFMNLSGPSSLIPSLGASGAISVMRLALPSVIRGTMKVAPPQLIGA